MKNSDVGNMKAKTCGKLIGSLIVVSIMTILIPTSVTYGQQEWYETQEASAVHYNTSLEVLQVLPSVELQRTIAIDVDVMNVMNQVPNTPSEELSSATYAVAGNRGIPLIK